MAFVLLVRPLSLCLCVLFCSNICDSHRLQKQVSFLELNDGSSQSNMQLVGDGDMFKKYVIQQHSPIMISHNHFKCLISLVYSMAVVLKLREH